MFESPFTEEETEVYTLGPSPAGRWALGPEPPPPSCSSPPWGPRALVESPREGAVERLTFKVSGGLPVCGLVATGRWWGLGVVRIGGPDPMNPALGALGASLV